jgi:hypothetical protein
MIAQRVSENLDSEGVNELIKGGNAFQFQIAWDVEDSGPATQRKSHS